MSGCFTIDRLFTLVREDLSDREAAYRVGSIPQSVFGDSQAAPDLLDQRGLVRESAALELGIQPGAADGQLEAAPLRGDHCVPADRPLVARQELGRQTDSLGLVVSEGAVFKHDFHKLLLPRGGWIGSMNFGDRS